MEALSSKPSWSGTRHWRLPAAAKFLSGENARIMNRTKADGSLDEATTEECREFADFYINNVSDEMRRKMSNQAGGLPFFLREGVAALVPSSLPFPWNHPLELSDVQLVQVGLFMKYVESFDNDVLAMFCIINPDGGQPTARKYALPKDAPLEGDAQKRGLIMTSVAYVIQFGGKIVLQERQPDKKSILMGFFAKDGMLRLISGERLSQDYDKNPNIEFKIPDWP